METLTQICCTCKQEKPLDAFRNERKRKNGKSSQCRLCRAEWYQNNLARERERGRNWHKENPERSKRNTQDFKLRKNFGITIEQYEQMLLEQQNLCAICQSPSEGQALGVDHNHHTGQVRALLCSQCNFGLGHFKENPALLHAAVAYLEHWNALI